MQPSCRAEMILWRKSGDLAEQMLQTSFVVTECSYKADCALLHLLHRDEIILAAQRKLFMLFCTLKKPLFIFTPPWYRKNRACFNLDWKEQFQEHEVKELEHNDGMVICFFCLKGFTMVFVLATIGSDGLTPPLPPSSQVNVNFFRQVAIFEVILPFYKGQKWV